MKDASEPDKDALLHEKFLLSDLMEVDKKISELERERDVLRRRLARLRHEKLAPRDVTRKNSFNRILVETKITEFLKASKKPVSTQRLFVEAQDISYSIKNVTFRSQLTRLKAKGLIRSPRRGYWTAAAD